MASVVEADQKWIPEKKQKVNVMVGLVQLLFAAHIGHLPVEMLLEVFEFLSLHDIARSVVGVCRQWRDLCYTELSPKELHVNSHNTHLYKYAVKNYKLRALFAHNGSLQQIAKILLDFDERRLASTFIVANGVVLSIQSNKESFDVCGKITKLAIDADQAACLTQFPLLTHLQLLHGIGQLPRFSNIVFDNMIELAVDKDYLFRNFESIRKLFPSLKKIHVTNDPEAESSILFEELWACGIELNITVEYLLVRICG